jgi:protein-L-isoaspartate(D-aspartate) O-methyltransferase
VYSIERHAKLSASAASTIKKVNAIGLNIQMNMFVGDGTKGLPEHGPYNKIIVTAGAPSVPKALVKQLSIGGLLVIPVGGEKDMQRMVRITKVDATNIKTEVFEQFSFVPLLGENGWK